MSSYRMRAGQRRGFALAMSIVAIVVIGALIAGAFFSSTQEFRIGRNTLIEQRSFSLAEYGLNSEIASWPHARNLPCQFDAVLNKCTTGMRDGDVVSQIFYLRDGDTAKVTVTKLNKMSYWVVSEGNAGLGDVQGQSMRRTSVLVRLAYPQIAVGGAVVTAGDLTVTGNAKISGVNTPPVGWSQCDSIGGTDTAAVAVAPTATVSVKAGALVGPIPIARQPAAADSNTYIRYGTETWNSLAANADIKLTSNNPAIAPVGSVSGAVTSFCNNTGVNHETNWGEPFRTVGFIDGCKDYFPIIYSPGDLHLNGQGRGQGILLVNGSLQLNGSFDFYGLVIVRNDINKGNGSATIHGSVMAQNVVLSDGGSIFTGTQDVYYSKCALESALRGSAVLLKTTGRGWAQLF